MIEAFVGTLIVVGLAMAGLALGSLFGGKPIKGSCGGLACIEGTRCAGCTRQTEDTP